MEDRLRFYEEGVAPKKNITAMQVCACVQHLWTSLLGLTS